MTHATSVLALSARMRTFGRRALALVSLVGRRFAEDKVMLNASALTFTTLLALVPLTAVSLSLFAAFPVGEQAVQQAEAFIFQNFVPATGARVQLYVSELAGKAAALTGPGFVFLLIASLLLVASIDRAFNDIWRVRRKRRPLNKFLVYWAVVTLGPLLMGLSVVATSNLLSHPLLSSTLQDTGLIASPVRWTPWLASTLAFTLLYSLVPLRRVRTAHALVGGVTAALLFEIAKKGFVAYVTYFPAYEAIYGALATIPIFLVWVYVAWLVTLLGAEVTFCLAEVGLDDGSDRTPAHRLTDVLLVLSALWRRRQGGGGLTLESLEKEVCLPGHLLEPLLDALAKRRWVVLSDRDRWYMGRDLDSLRLADLYDNFPLSLPAQRELAALKRDEFRVLTDRLSDAALELEKIMDVPLKELFGPRAQ